MPKILLDTSVWICYFRPQGWGELKKAVQNILREHPIFTCDVVKTELLIGTKTAKEFQRLQQVLDPILSVPINPELWLTTAQLGFQLRRNGLTIPLTDLLIAQAAITTGTILWHLDAHFEVIAAHSSLKTQSFLPEC